jgi:hypothetical protein
MSDAELIEGVAASDLERRVIDLERRVRQLES